MVGSCRHEVSLMQELWCVCVFKMMQKHSKSAFHSSIKPLPFFPLTKMNVMHEGGGCWLRPISIPSPHPPPHPLGDTMALVPAADGRMLVQRKLQLSHCNTAAHLQEEEKDYPLRKAEEKEKMVMGGKRRRKL